MLRSQCGINSKTLRCEKDKLEVLYSQVCADCACRRLKQLLSMKVIHVENQEDRGAIAERTVDDHRNRRDKGQENWTWGQMTNSVLIMTLPLT